MQRPHRNRHRLLWLLIFPAALLALIYAVANRPEWPIEKAETPTTMEGRER
ncbi:MAG: hypothetical protein AAF514_13715 [Verrucomicrobiota bacterium]